MVQVLPLSQVNAQTTGLLASSDCISDPLSCCLHVNCIEINALTTGLYIQSLYISGRFSFGLDTVVRKVENAKKHSYIAHLSSEIFVNWSAMKSDLCSLFGCSLYQRPGLYMNFNFCVTPIRLKGHAHAYTFVYL